MLRQTALFALVVGCGSDAPAETGTTAESGDQCGTLECEDGLRLSLVAQAGTFAAGSYVVSLGPPGLASQCEFVVADDMAACAGETSCIASTTCDGAEFNLSLPPSYGLFFVPGSGSVQVIVERGGEVLVDEVLEPSYVEHAPNGSDCEPVCLVAEAQVLVP